ncbi:MAG: type III pantothenate kinase [Bacteroidales bacterium]|nr:type III pantothenate kinase [Bacteroidales bacterium]
MNLIVDIGNSLTKLFVFEQGEIIHNSQFDEMTEKEIVSIFRSYQKISHCIISSVKNLKEDHLKLIQNKLKSVIFLDNKTILPISNNYKSPETLGKDRIAAIVGAYNIFPEQHVLVVDAGTAITFDFINNMGVYNGGNISPGLSMRFKALNQFTERLPLLKPKENEKFMGENTHEAIIAGVQNGIIFEIETYIDKFLEQYPDLKVILTGGDTFFFAHKLKNRIFAKPFLVAIGLNRILLDNVKEN